jgi:hypothetical protein
MPEDLSRILKFLISIIRSRIYGIDSVMGDVTETTWRGETKS